MLCVCFWIEDVLYDACMVLDEVSGEMDMYSGGVVIELCNISGFG
jgi:hypothetical protein